MPACKEHYFLPGFEGNCQLINNVKIALACAAKKARLHGMFPLEKGGRMCLVSRDGGWEY